MQKNASAISLFPINRWNCWPPIRCYLSVIVATIAFIAMICAYVYVPRHLRKIEKTIVANNLVPSELGPRNNMVLMVYLIPLIGTALLLYLVIKT